MRMDRRIKISTDPGSEVTYWVLCRCYLCTGDNVFPKIWGKFALSVRTPKISGEFVLSVLTAFVPRVLLVQKRSEKFGFSLRTWFSFLER